jgi:hypothetical protein
MIINYWDCPHHEYDEAYGGGTEVRIYGCKHPNGDGWCDLENKYGQGTADCKLLTTTDEQQPKYRKFAESFKNERKYTGKPVK